MPPQQQLVLDNRAPPSREQGSARSGGVVALLSRAFGSHGRQSVPRLHNSSSLLIRTSEAIPAAQHSESSFFSNSREFNIQGGSFENRSGPTVNVTINTGSHPQEQTTTTAHGAGPSVAPVGGSNDSEYRYMGGHNEQSSHTDVACDNDAFTARPPILPIQRPCDIYYRHLSVKGRGSPLWLPGIGRQLPIEYRRKGISIGDVGLITVFGSFDFLFNILLPSDHPIHGGRVPQGFIPLDPPLQAEDVDIREEFAEDSYLASASVKKAQNLNGQENSFGLRFETTDSEGAILTMPSGSDSSNLFDTARFYEYLEANMVNWYCYANATRGRQAKNGDLRLITGWDKAKAWGMATFSRSLSTGQPPFQLNFKPLEQTGRTYKWEYSGIADGRTGPSVRESTDLRLPGDPDDITFTNQCLFIRTMNPLLSENTWKRLESTKFSAVKLENSGSFNSNSDNSEILLSGKGKGKAVDPGSPMPGHGSFELNSVVQSSDSATALPFHPSTAINKYLLNQNPDARMAITEDINWISVLTEDDYSLPPGDQILRRVMERHEIGREKGIVFLRQLVKLNILDHSAASKAPIDTYERLSQFDNLREHGNALARSFDQQSNLNNLDEAIALYRQALEIIPSSDINHRGIQSDLAEALLYRYHLFHQVNDFNDAVRLYTQEPQFSLHPIHIPEVYSNVGNAALRAFYQQRQAGGNFKVDPESTSSSAGLEECILLQRLALEILPPSHPHRPSILDVLAGILIYQIYQNSWDVTEENEARLEGRLDEAISLRRQALELVSPSDQSVSHLGILLSLAESLNFRYRWSNQLCDLDEAIYAHRQLLDLLPSSHPCQPTILKYLAMELLDRYVEEKQPSDLDGAILLFKQCLHIPLFRPDRRDILDALSEALFELRGTPRSDVDEDLLLDLAKASGEGRWYYKSSIKNSPQRSSEKAIFFQRQALQLSLPSSYNRAYILCELAETLSTQRKLESPLYFQTEPKRELGHVHEHPSQQTDQLDDSRTEAVTLYRQALNLIPPSHSRQFDTLHRFSELLITLYEDEGELPVALLDEAILLQNRALEFRSLLDPDPLHSDSVDSDLVDPDYFYILSDLANMLACRYEQGGELTDLHKSISFNKQALESEPYYLPAQKEFSLLSNLAHALACRFEVESKMNDLDEAIDLNRQATKLTLPPREIQAAFVNLGNTLSRRFEQTKQIADIDETINIANRAISRISPSDPDISQFYGSLRVAQKLRAELTGQTDETQTSWPQATSSIRIPRLDDYLGLTRNIPSQIQSDALDKPEASSAGSQSVEGGDKFNRYKLVPSRRQTNKKDFFSPDEENHEQSSRNEDTMPISSDKLSTKGGPFTQLRRRLSSSSVVSDQ